MELMTKDQKAKLKENMKKEDLGDEQPVVKWFTPSANCTWLIIGLDEDEELAFGLCDLGLGFPEIGYVSMEELRDLGNHTPFKMPVERDLHWTPRMTLREYADLANQKQGIVG